MEEKGIRRGTYDALHQYAQASNKHIKDYDKNKESSCLKYWKILEDCDEAYFLGFDVQYPKEVLDLYNQLPFLPKRMKIKKFKKLVANFHDQKYYFIYIRNFKTNAK